ncbi:MAG: DeoR family transcriptional regulator [Actinomycetota bacterium]
MLPADRHRRILELIGEGGSVRVADLVEDLGVSRMTINRDLDSLDEQGSLTKVFGGAIARREPEVGSTRLCEMCGAELGSRTSMTLFDDAGAHAEACCSHCGLMLMSQREGVTSALAQDFLGGQMVNVRSATFLVQPDFTLCCAPTVLCFEDAVNAKRFHTGFGGELMDWEAAQVSIREHMMFMTKREKTQ